MNKFVIGIVFVAIALSATAAQATGITTGAQVTILGSSGNLGGGPFAVDGPDADNVADFLTFCLEINEFISYNTSYYVNIATGAVSGGAGGPSPDPLSSTTAYLYSNFLDGTLAGYDATKSSHRNGLQLAVWRSEEEVYRAADGYRRSDTHALVGTSGMWAKADAFFALASSNAVAGNLYGVQVMQLWTDYNATTGTFSGNAQDQLIRVSVPDATSTFSALLIGMLLLGLVRIRHSAG